MIEGMCQQTHRAEGKARAEEGYHIGFHGPAGTAVPLERLIPSGRNHRNAQLFALLQQQTCIGGARHKRELRITTVRTQSLNHPLHEGRTRDLLQVRPVVHQGVRRRIEHEHGRAAWSPWLLCHRPTSVTETISCASPAYRSSRGSWILNANSDCPMALSRASKLGLASSPCVSEVKLKYRPAAPLLLVAFALPHIMDGGRKKRQSPACASTGCAICSSEITSA